MYKSNQKPATLEFMSKEESTSVKVEQTVQL